MSGWPYDEINLPPDVGPQGPYGASNAFADIYATLSSAQANGARVNAGINTGIGTGTLTGAVQSATSLLASTPRSNLTTPAGAGTGVAYRNGLGIWWRGNAAGLGGFTARFRFAVTSFLVGHRAFTGFRNTVAQIGNVDPSTLVNVIGMGYDAGATQWSIMHNDAAGACTVVPLGASFNVSTTDLLELTLTAAANAASVDWLVRNLSTPASQAGNIAANLPANNIFLSTHVWSNTGADATTPTACDLVDVVIQTPTL